MSHPSSSCSEAHIGRDQNNNYGPGPFTIHNDNRMVQQTVARRTRWQIQGTEEEEERYAEYSEYKHGDIQIIGAIHSERVKDRYDPTTRRYVPINCERSIALGKIVSGEGIGTIVTVESYEGEDAPKEWKQRFLCHTTGKSFFQRTNENAHLLALNRSKVPLLIYSGGLVPLTHFWRNFGWLGVLYFDSLSAQWGGDGTWSGLWMDPARGAICQGPDGPCDELPDADYVPIRNLKLASTADLLQEDVFLRFLASQSSREVDDAFISAIQACGRQRKDVPEFVSWPTVFSSLTQAPIAFASYPWKSYGSLVEQKVLENGLTRFRLDGDKTLISLSNDPRTAWLAQASSIFCVCGISLEEDLSFYRLVWCSIQLYGYLNASPNKSRQQRQQSIYFFFCSPPPDLLDGKETSSLHFWSFHEDGRYPLSTEVCDNLGLPIALQISPDLSCSYSWSTKHFKLIHRYQLLQGFDPTTTDFARHLGHNNHLFQPIDNSDRFTEVHKDQDSPHLRPPGNDIARFTVNPNSDTQCQQSIPDAVLTGNGRVQGAVREGNPNDNQNPRLLPPTFPHFTGPVPLHSFEHTYLPQQCSSQIHPQSSDDRQQYFPYPHISQTSLSRDALLNTLHTPASMDFNSLSSSHTSAGWPAIPQYIANELPTPSVNTARHSEGTAQGVGWSGALNTFSDSSLGPITFTQLGVPQVMPMPDLFDKPFTFDSWRTGIANLPDSDYTDPSVNTTMINSALSDHMAQGSGWSGPSESGTTGNSEFDGYPMEVDTDSDFSCSMTVD